MDIKKYTKYLGLIAIIVLVIALTPRFLELEVADFVEQNSGPAYLAAMTILVFYMLKPMVWAIPQALLCISAGILFPMGWAIAITALGNVFELSIGYFIGARWGRERVDALVAKNKRAQKFLGGEAKTKPSLCFIASLLPLPKALVSMFFGASSLQYKQFLPLSIGGNAPAIALYLFIGYTLIGTVLL